MRKILIFILLLNISSILIAAKKLNNFQEVNLKSLNFTSDDLCDEKYLNSNKFPALESFSIEQQNLKTLDLSGSPSLKTLEILYLDNLKSVYLHKKVKLESLSAYEVDFDILAQIDTSQLKILILKASYNQLKNKNLLQSFNKLKFPELEFLFIMHAYDNEVNFNLMPKLELLYLGGLQVNSLDFLRSSCPNLKNLRICNMEKLKDFFVLKELPLETLTIEDISASRWLRRSQLPKKCKVVELPPVSKNPYFIWVVL
ncbi:hypothetical protein AAEX28_09440 [Lentisphaerota bacterium WC36G]|nr:hypothetical protein LJT99_12280 [Lentisphaerae bacterium WC36]